MARAVGVAEGPQRRGGPGPNLDGPPHGHRLRDLFHLDRYRAQVEARTRERQLAILASGDEQQIVDHFRGAVELPLHGDERFAYFRVGASFRRRPLHLRAQVGDGRAQLVARVGREGLQRAVAAVHPLEHAIDRVGELGDLRLTGRAPDALAELGRADRARLGRNPTEWLQRVAHRLPPAFTVVRVITTCPPMPTSCSASAAGITPPALPPVESVYAPTSDCTTSAECSRDRRSTASAARANDATTSRA